MILNKRLGKELVFFSLTAVASFLFWLVLAMIVEQNIIAQECLYEKETSGFVVSIAFFYFIRLITWMAL